MMKGATEIISAVIIMHISWSQCFTTVGQSQPQAVGAYAYQDSHGHRYEGTYELKNGKVEYRSAKPLPFKTVLNPVIPNDDSITAPQDFYPTFFTHFDNFIQEYFPYNFEEQRLALDAAQRAFDLTVKGSKTPTKFPSLASVEHPLTANSDYSMPSFTDNVHHELFNNFAIPNPNNAFGFLNNFNAVNDASNKAFASAVAGPDLVHQIAGVSPMNLQEPNIDHSAPSVMPLSGQPQFKSVYSTSFARNTNVNGQVKSERGAESYVNDNGKVTKYKVHS